MATASTFFETGPPCWADLARSNDGRFLDVADPSAPTAKRDQTRTLKLSRSVANIAHMAANRGISPVRSVAKKVLITSESTPVSTPVLPSKKGHHR